MRVATTVVRTLTWKPRQGPLVMIPDSRRRIVVGPGVSIPEHLPVPALVEARVVATRDTQAPSAWLQVFAHPVVDGVEFVDAGERDQIAAALNS